MGFKFYKKPRVSRRQSETQPLKEVINSMLKEMHVEKRYQYAVITSSWEKVMGKTVARRTSKLFIKDKKLFVKLESAPLKQELSMAKAKILDLLNAQVGESVLEDIIFI